MITNTDLSNDLFVYVLASLLKIDMRYLQQNAVTYKHLTCLQLLLSFLLQSYPAEFAAGDP